MPVKTLQQYLQEGETLYTEGKFTEAIESFKQALLIDANDAGANYGVAKSYNDYGNKLYNEKNINAAHENFLEAVKYYDNFHTAHSNLGLTFMKLGDYENSWKHIQTAINQKPDDVSVYNILQDLLKDHKEYAAKVKPFLQGFTANNPASADFWFSLAYCCDKLEAYTEAIENYNEGLAINPANNIAIGNIGLAYEKLDQVDNAISYYKKSLEKMPWLWAYNQLLNICFYNKQLPEFIAAAKELCKHDIDFSEANYFNIVYYNDLIGNNDDTITFLKEFTATKKNDALLYRNLGYAYSNNRNFSDATDQQAKAVQVNATAENYYILGNAYLDILSYKEAINNYDKALKLNPDFIYAKHNKNYILEKQGRYRQAYEEWTNIVKDYHRLLESGKKDDSIIATDAYCYLGDVYLFNMDKSNLENALDSYEKAIAADSININPYIGLVRYYAEKKIQITDQTKASNATDADDLHSDYNMAHMNLYDYFTKGVQKLQVNLQRYKNRYELNNLGDLYLLAEQYDKAKECYTDCTKNFPGFQRAFVGLGVANMRAENYKDAILNYKTAIQFDPDDFNVQANLAEAYLKSGNLSDAEKTYRKILNFCPNYIDALMGLAEYNKLMGDKAMEENNVSDAEDWYQQARSKYDRLVDLYTSNEPASRRMNRADINNIFYSRGYVKVKLFEIGSNILNRPFSLKKGVKIFSLQSPRDDFKQILPGEDNYFKARNAIRKINNEIGNTKNISKKWAPPVVIIASLLVLVFTQYAFFFGRKESKPQTYSLDVSRLASVYITDSSLIPLVPALAGFAKSEFANKTQVTKLLDSLSSNKIKDADRFILMNEGLDERIPISETSYGLFTFSSFIFLIIGFFLAEITKLKVGSIELEKSVLDTASTSPSLGIKGK